MLNGTQREMAKTRRCRCAGMWRQARQLLALAVVAVIVSGSLLIKVQAAPGALDTTFSTDGKVNTGFFTNSDDSASGIAIQTNGKIVIAGSVKSNGSKHNFALARYTGD